MTTRLRNCLRCNDDGFYFVAHGNPFEQTILHLAHSMRRVGCDCRAGDAWRDHLSYNQAVADETARITR